MLAVTKRAVDDNIICLSATQLMHASAHRARNTVQQLLRKTQLHYPRDAMLARVLAIIVCPSVCLSHAGIVSERLNVESRKQRNA